MSFTVNLHELSDTQLRVEYSEPTDCLAITVGRDATTPDDDVNLFLRDAGWSQVLAACVRRLVVKTAQVAGTSRKAAAIVAAEIEKAAQS